VPDVRELLTKPEFPRSNGYDPDWVLDGWMGPNPLWLAEWLTQELPLESGDRVLDLGCGKALTSVFLAREFDVRVHAVDLWVSADDNWKRVVAAGAQDRVMAVHAEAHALPFGAGCFDAVVSVDAWQYFGTDVMYLQYLTRFVKPGGLIGIVVPGLAKPFPGGVAPEHLTRPQAHGKPFWEDECACFLPADWWRRHFEQTGFVDVLTADLQPDGWRHWRDMEVAAEQADASPFPSDAEALEADAGEYIGFVRVVARVRGEPAANYYDGALLDKVRGEAGD